MKKIGLLFGVAALGLVASCSNNETTKDENTEPVSIICPEGTPSLGLANYYDSVEGAKFDIVKGPEQLIPAFGKKTHDIIVAPVNLGAKFYNTNGNYVLASTFVWGNLFLASKADFTSFSDLDGKKLVVFGKNATPDIITKLIIKEKNLNVTVSYVGAGDAGVAEANSLLVSGAADYIVTSEPAISGIKDAQGIHVVDLQEEYASVTGKSSYPQAGIFIKKEDKNNQNVLNTVDLLINSVKDTVKNPEDAAENAVLMSEYFEDLGSATLVKAIPNCHYAILDKNDEKAAVVEYLQNMIDLGFSAQVGGKIPSDEFFL